jgi:hypothetical protein
MRSAIVLLVGIVLFSPAALLAQDAQNSDQIIIDPSPESDLNQTHLRAEYLWWYLRRLHVPPLLTAGPVGSTASLDAQGTEILRGGDPLDSRHNRYVGIRAVADRWLDLEQTIGLEADLVFLERDSSHLTVRPGSVPVLAIPFFDASSGRPSSFVVSGFNPQFGNLTGGTVVYSRMELFGQEGNLLYNLARSGELEWNLLAGGRFLQLRERLDLTSSARILPAKSILIGLEDHFQTFDKFYGGQVGIEGTWRCGRWSVEGKAAIALGADDQEIRNKGTFIYHTPQQRQETPIGLFVQPSNRGAFERTAFDVVTELRFNVRYELTRHLQLQAGYSLLTWDGPVRPGDQVMAINRTQGSAGGLVGPVTPLPQFKEDFFWAHGANAGLEVRW